MAPNDILVVGSVALDSVETPFGKSEAALGGSAVFFSLAARHFNPVRLVGVVGKDFPRSFRDLLVEHRIDLEGLTEADGRTFRWCGRFGRDLREATTLETALNVFKDFRPTLTPNQRGCSTVFLGNIDPELQMDVLSQLKAPRLVACDTHEYWIRNKGPALKELLSKVDILFINEEEAGRLSRQFSLLKAARTLASWGPRLVVVKKGEHGVHLWFQRHLSLPAYPVEDVRDPTGAGDSFAGGFLGYLSSQEDWEDLSRLKRAALYGAVLASFNVEDFSTHRLAKLKTEAIHERFRELVDSLRVVNHG